MSKKMFDSPWGKLLLLNTLGLGVLGLYQTSWAQPKDPPTDRLPFANAVEQRTEMINQLKQLNALLKEQNALLQSGKLRVIAVSPDKKK